MSTFLEIETHDAREVVILPGTGIWFWIDVKGTSKIITVERIVEGIGWTHIAKFDLKDIESVNLRESFGEEIYNMLIQKLFELI